MRMVCRLVPSNNLVIYDAINRVVERFADAPTWARVLTHLIDRLDPFAPPMNIRIGYPSVTSAGSRWLLSLQTRCRTLTTAMNKSDARNTTEVVLQCQCNLSNVLTFAAILRETNAWFAALPDVQCREDARGDDLDAAEQTVQNAVRDFWREYAMKRICLKRICFSRIRACLWKGRGNISDLPLPVAMIRSLQNFSSDILLKTKFLPEYRLVTEQ